MAENNMEHKTQKLKMAVLNAINFFQSNKDRSKYNFVISQLVSDLIWKEVERMLAHFEECDSAVQKYKYVGKCCCFLFDLLNEMSENDYFFHRTDKIKDICTNINTHLENYTDNIDEIIKKCNEECNKFL